MYGDLHISTTAGKEIGAAGNEWIGVSKRAIDGGRRTFHEGFLLSRRMPLRAYKIYWAGLVQFCTAMQIYGANLGDTNLTSLIIVWL